MKKNLTDVEREVAKATVVANLLNHLRNVCSYEEMMEKYAYGNQSALNALARGMEGDQTDLTDSLYFYGELLRILKPFSDIA